jgi:hypothetical protein
MPANPIRDTLQAIGEALIQHIYFVLESGKYPLNRRSSALLKSLRVEVRQGRDAGGRFEGFTANSSLELYALDYLEYLDRGRPRFVKKVPLDALIAWLRKRTIGQNRQRNGRYGKRTVKLNQLAFIIQNSIYRNGIRGRNFLAPAFDEAQNLLDIYVNSQLLDDVTMELTRTFKKA